MIQGGSPPLVPPSPATIGEGLAIGLPLVSGVHSPLRPPLRPSRLRCKIGRPSHARHSTLTDFYPLVDHPPSRLVPDLAEPLPEVPQLPIRPFLVARTPLPRVRVAPVEVADRPPLVQSRLDTFLPTVARRSPTVAEEDSSSDGEWLPEDDQQRWLHLGRRAAARREPWFQSALAEDWFRLAYLAPMCGAPPSHPATCTHAFGATRVSLEAAIPAWPELRSTLLASSTRNLPERLLTSFQARLSLPHVFDEASFWGSVARYISSMHGPGGSRSGVTASWCESTGFSLHVQAGGVAPGRSLSPTSVWGECHEIPISVGDFLDHLGNSSGRSLVSSRCRCLHSDAHDKSCGRRHYVLLGTLSLINSRCANHANLLPAEDPHFDPPLRFGRLARGEWTRASTSIHAPFLKEGVELTLHYGDLYRLPCLECTGAVPAPQRWKGAWGDGPLPSDDSASSSDESVASPVSAASPLSSCCELPSDWSDPVVEVHTPPTPERRRSIKSRPHVITATSFSGSPITEFSDATFGMGALNVMSRLSLNQFTTYFPRLLRLFVGLRLSVMALADTGTTEGLDQLDPMGVSVRAHTMPDGSVHSVHSLWSLMGLNMGGRQQKSGSGVSLLWDSSLSYEDPWTDAHGRAVAVTLLGEGKKATRFMAVYGYASPGNWGDRPKDLLEALTAQRLFARRKRIRFAVLGELNDSPRHDRTLGFARPEGYSEHGGLSLTASLLSFDKEAALSPLRDAFRTMHPDLNGATRAVRKQAPARHTLVLTPRRWRITRASVDSARTWWTGSDHYLLLVGVPYHMVTGHKVRPPALNNERVFVPGLCTKFLRTPHIRKAWQETLLTSDSWGEVQGLLAGVEAATVEDIQRVVTKLEDSITESMSPYQPKPASSRSKPTPPPLSPVWDVLEAEADQLKLASTQSHDASGGEGAYVSCPPIRLRPELLCGLGPGGGGS